MSSSTAPKDSDATNAQPASRSGASPVPQEYNHDGHHSEPTQWGSRSVANSHDEDSVGMNMNSRKRRFISGAFKSRKRAAMACNFCRLRKTKCDNARPKCGYCRHHNATCVYDDTVEAAASAPAPEYDESASVLQRLDEIKGLLQRMQPANGSNDVSVSIGVFGQNPSHGAAHLDLDTGPERESPADDIRETGEPLHAINPYASPYRAARCEAIVRWPIFKDWLSEKETKIESFLHEADTLVSDRGSIDGPELALSQTQSTLDNTERGARGIPNLVIDEEDLVPLCKSFLGHVHFRNPILEPEELMMYAKRAAQNGIGWDAHSCLVLVISAISCILSSETTNSEQSPDDPTHVSRLPSRILANPFGAAEAFSHAAKKRIGLLGMSIPDIQCLFFLSIYEKLRIRPLLSWFYLQQACSRLKSHLMSQSGGARSWAYDKQAKHQIEQRVFWSCVRAETELLPDMCLPSSGLDSFQYPEFPSPPSATSQPNSNPFSKSGTSGYVAEKSQAQSWLFFLAEISLRRTINAHLRLLYRKSESYWLSHLPLLIKHHAQCEEQINLWYSHLPEKLQFSTTRSPSRSLSFYLESRFQDWREYILRPLLYCALHDGSLETRSQHVAPVTPIEPSPSTPSEAWSTSLPSRFDPVAALSPEVRRLAQSHIALCAHLVPRTFEHGRFGGVWLLCRRTFTCGMAILASVISDQLQCPDKWVELCRSAVRFLAQWSAEAPSVEAMRRVLDGLFERVLRSHEGRIHS